MRKKILILSCKFIIVIITIISVNTYYNKYTSKENLDNYDYDLVVDTNNNHSIEKLSYVNNEVNKLNIDNDYSVTSDLILDTTYLKPVYNNKVDYLLYLEKGSLFTINYSIEPSSSIDQGVTITTNNPNLITIINNVIFATDLGNSVVTITSNSNPNLSKKIRVITMPGSAIKAPTYDKIKEVKKIRSSDINYKYSIPVTNDIYVTQSMAISNNYIIFNQVKKDSSKSRIRFVNKYTYNQEYSIDYNKKLGHANGSTFNFNTGMVYTGIYASNYKELGLYCLNVDDNNIRNSTEVPCDYLNNTYVNRITYDRVLNVYITTNGYNLTIYDSNFNQIDKYYNVKLRTTNQDIFSYNGVVYMATSSNNIDLYRISDGKYLGSYRVSGHELEDIEIYDSSKGQVAILFYVSGDHKDKFGITSKLRLYK